MADGTGERTYWLWQRHLPRRLMRSSGQTHRSRSLPGDTGRYAGARDMLKRHAPDSAHAAYARTVALR